MIPSAGASNNTRMMEHVCVRACAFAQGPFFEGDYASLVACPNITVQYHHSGNFWIAQGISGYQIKQDG
jgi:hypothetical protein